MNFDNDAVLPANERAYQMAKKVRDLAREEAFRGGMPVSEVSKIIIVTSEMAAKHEATAARLVDDWMKVHA